MPLMSNTIGEWVTLWSPQQKAFHVETTREMLRKNMTSYMEGTPNQYICVAIVNSHDEAHEIIKILKDGRHKLFPNEDE